jgi:hypothetical protein
MNPRCVGSCHHGALFGHDLCGALVAELTGASVARKPSIAGPRLVALFPKELQRDPDSPYLCTPDVLHDVPEGDLELTAAYVGFLAKLNPARADSIRQKIERSLSRVSSYRGSQIGKGN